MRALRASFAVMGALISFCICSPGGSAEPQAGFAVVELFTSEGCSSCPRADELLGRIDQAATEAEARVIVLSMHVDYWNRLGWVDPFSSPEMTGRQRGYAAAAGDRSVYTPQMIVNGQDRFVGSNSSEASRAINAALSSGGANAVSVTAALVGRAIDIEYEAFGDLSGARLNVAVVQRQATRQASRGENAGRTLRHVNVVRAWRSLDAQPAGGARIELPDDFEGTPRVVAFLQSEVTKRIVAAASTDPAS